MEFPCRLTWPLTRMNEESKTVLPKRIHQVYIIIGGLGLLFVGWCLLYTRLIGRAALDGIVPVSEIYEAPTRCYFRCLLVGLGLIAAWIIMLIRRRSIPSALLPTVGLIAIAAALLVGFGGLDARQRERFLRGVAQKVQEPGMLDTISAWRRDSTAELRRGGYAGGQGTAKETLLELKRLFLKHNTITDINLEHCAGFSNCGMITFRDKDVAWGVNFGCNDLSYSWVKDFEIAVTNDVRVFVGRLKSR